ncbi:protein of unknown function [Saccharopolyspora flava]|uniref:Bacterial phospholipase C C-terminal domain-containing protein n=2 Tax=Saccharopolyspora flava TaxID=95161 RepID=A0A1I6NZE5_9PSEU|nr:protein of unknown function [Saccharopolyspora flava]
MTGRFGPASASQPSVGGVVVDGRSIALRLGYVGSDFARFAIRAGGGSAAPCLVDVLGEKYVTIPVAARYRVAVEGPSDIRMELGGSLGGSASRVDVQARHTARGLVLELRNNGLHEVGLDLRARAHADHETSVRLAGGGALPLFWPVPDGHYDLEVTSPEDDAFHRRVRGKTEPHPAD